MSDEKLKEMFSDLDDSTKSSYVRTGEDGPCRFCVHSTALIDRDTGGCRYHCLNRNCSIGYYGEGKGCFKEAGR